jgi:hypothetical protein
MVCAPGCWTENQIKSRRAYVAPDPKFLIIKLLRQTSAMVPIADENRVAIEPPLSATS